MSADAVMWLEGNGQWLALLAALAFPAVYLAWVNRPNPVYCSSRLLEFPIEAVFEPTILAPGRI